MNKPTRSILQKLKDIETQSAKNLAMYKATAHLSNQYDIYTSKYKQSGEINWLLLADLTQTEIIKKQLEIFGE
jgi:lipid II:glycine glycyltransferase (peptidoglycan interpeptide bridge formation enzyme)